MPRTKRADPVKRLEKKLRQIDLANKKQFRALNKKITVLNGFKKDLAASRKDLSKLKGKFANLSSKVATIEKAWNIQTLKKALGDITLLSKTLRTLQKDSSNTLKKLNSVNAGIVAISKHASDIQAEHLDAKFAAEELAKKSENLRDTLEYFTKQTDIVNSKLSANASALADLVTAVEGLKSKISELDAQTTKIPQIDSVLKSQEEAIAQLSAKLARLEKAAVKTIVID